MITESETAPACCHVCGATDLETAPAYSQFQRVTSDCKPWPPGGMLARCNSCGFVQTLVTSQWQREADQIYANYAIYHQGGGTEQNVFDNRSGGGKPRSAQIIQAMRGVCALPAKGRLLDIGCGNGSFLSAWSQMIPGWNLCGTEVSEKYKAQVEAIPGFEQLFTYDLMDLPGTFNVISLIHVLEHIPNPITFLRRIKEKLTPDGMLVVEVPDCQQNFFALLVADHCSHFSTSLLAGMVSAAGFEVRQATNTWVTKEVSVVASHGLGLKQSSAVNLPRFDSLQVFNGWQHLQRSLEKARPLAKRDNFGLFGTAIAATWLDAQLGQAAQFFVDEDTNRVGKNHLGRPILAPADVPPGSIIFVALPQPLATYVIKRLNNLQKNLQLEQP